MANIQLKNDVLIFYPILTLDNSGDVVPAKAGDTFTVTTDNTQLNAEITTNSGIVGVELNALVAVSAASIALTITDADGLKAFDGFVDIVTDFTPTSIGLDLSNPMQLGTQPVPNTTTTGTQPGTGTTAASTSGTVSTGTATASIAPGAAPSGPIPAGAVPAAAATTANTGSNPTVAGGGATSPAPVVPAPASTVAGSSS